MATIQSSYSLNLHADAGDATSSNRYCLGRCNNIILYYAKRKKTKQQSLYSMQCTKKTERRLRTENKIKIN